MDSSRLKIVVLLLLLPSALWLAAGCSSDEALSTAAQDGPGFQAELTLCRKVSRRSGRPIGESDQFLARKKSYVNAVLTCEEVQPDRPYVVHLVWVKPDGKELYRRYAEVVQNANPEGGRRTVISWLDAEDLHKIKRDTVMSENSSFTLNTRLNTSLKKERDAGQWEMRVYLDRRFLLSRAFELQVPEPDIATETSGTDTSS